MVMSERVRRKTEQAGFPSGLVELVASTLRRSVRSESRDAFRPRHVGPGARPCVRNNQFSESGMDCMVHAPLDA